MTDSIRILIVDDHPLLRAGLRALIDAEPDMTVVAEAGDGIEAQRLFVSFLPDIVLMDLRLPGIGGVEAILAIRKDFPAARIIVITTYDTDEDVHRALQSGAQSYLLKDMPKEQIFSVIRSVHAGEPTLPGRIEAMLQERMARPELSPREIEVLQSLSKGLSNKEIAESLAISEDTVKFRLKGLFAKLGVPDRTAAVMSALRHGILHLE